MKLTNKLGLPQAVVDCVKNDDYDNGGAWRSVTQLVAPPRQIVLKMRHDDEIEQDVSERLYMMYGQLVHALLERANVDDLVERRLFIRVRDRLISGAFDSLRWEFSRLSDWKFSTAWKAVDLSPEWVWQMNFLRLLFKDGFWNKECTDKVNVDIDELEIVLLMRDHSKPRAKRDKDYPPLPISRMKVPVWEFDACRAFLDERVLLHLRAEENLPECSDTDRWARPTVYAVMKKTRKQAVRLLPSKEFAENFIAEQKKPDDHFVVERMGEQVRCHNYCAAAPFCRQFETLKKVEVIDASGPA